MDERWLFLVAAVFLGALATALVGLGRHRGGVSWALAWASLYGMGLFLTVDPETFRFAPNVAIVLGTFFSALLFRGTCVYTQTYHESVRPLALITGGAIVARTIIYENFGAVASQSFGSCVGIVAVLASCWVLLHPASGRPGPWNKVLAAAFPLVILLTIGYLRARAGHEAVLPAMYAWLVVGILMATLEAGAFVSLASERMAALRDVASKSEKAQAEIEARYYEVVEHASDLIIELDGDARIIYANPAHRTILGIDPESLLGRSSDEMGLYLSSGIRPEDAEQRIAFVEDADGRLVTLECNIHRFRLQRGGKRIVVTSRDVTEREALNRARERAKAGLERLVEARGRELEDSRRELLESQRLASMGTMAAGVAHQINNPIGSIRMAAEFALTAPVPEGEGYAVYLDALANCVEQADRCGRIVSSMLQFARNEPTEKCEEDLGAIVRRACEQTETYAVKSLATISCRLAPDSVPVWASAIELEQAVLNLLRNACESSESHVEVVASVETHDGRAYVEIADDGLGMTSAQADRVVDPFFTTRLGDGGTGLGLSVAHGIVADHGGSLTIDSKPGQGTRVRFRLPLRTEPSVATAQVGARPDAY